MEENQLAGKSKLFPPYLVWAVNYVAQNPHPYNFVYLGFPYRLDTGRVCPRSLEFGGSCDHKVLGQPFYRFQLVFLDVAHVGNKSSRAQMWDNVVLLLQSLAA